MKILKNAFLVSSFILIFGAIAEELHFPHRDSTFVEILSSQYIASIKADSTKKIDFYTKNHDLVNSINLNFNVNHAFALSEDYFLVASLKRAPDPKAINKAILMKGDKIVERFSNVRNIHLIPGGQHFAIEVATKKENIQTYLKLFNIKGGLVKDGIISEPSRFRMVAISSDLNTVALSPFSTDSNSVLSIAVYSGESFSLENVYEFDNTRIYQTIPLANGLVAINVDRRIAAMSGTRAEWTIPNKKVSFSVDALKQASDPNYMIAEENTGRILIIGLDGEIAFDSNAQEGQTFAEIMQNGAYTDVVNEQLVINDSNRGEALIIPLNKPGQTKHIRESNEILSIDTTDGYIAFMKNEKLKIKKIK